MGIREIGGQEEAERFVVRDVFIADLNSLVISGFYYLL
jgi:hypothetical protein